MTDFASGFVVVPILLHPNSRGAITLRDADPLSPPRIDANYFTDAPLDEVRSSFRLFPLSILHFFCFVAHQILFV
jgi:hypothetical protein